MSNNPKTGSADHSSLLKDLFDNMGLAWSLIRDKRVSPWLRFGVPALAMAYVLFPVDLLPDVFPGLGQIDDLAAIVLALQFIVKTVSPEIVDEYRTRKGKQAGPAGDDGDYVDGAYRVVE
ncbi:MAG: DUF1232 domain-containing protein [Caldilineales bacterium]|nr:DUF1232 domain-containing protein [Caldilineales bacterium]